MDALRTLGQIGLRLGLLALLATAALHTHLALAEQPEPGSKTNRVLVLGDSISAAYGMSLEQGWVAVLEQRLVEKWPQIELVNASISGDTSAGGLRRLPALLQEHEPILFILELGGNDGLRGYPTNQLRDNLQEMTMLAQQSGASVLIVPMEIPPNYGPRYTSAFRAAFSETAEETGAELSRFILDGIATETSLMQSDGIHPTVDAQAMIADLLEPYVRSLLEKELSQ